MEEKLFSSAKLTNFSIFLEIFSQHKIGKKRRRRKKALVLCYCKSNLTIFILFIQGFELLVFRYTNISCKIGSTSSNKMACTIQCTLGWNIQPSNSIKWGPKWTSTLKCTTVDGWCLDGVWTGHFFFRWVLVPRANLPMDGWGF